MSSCKGRDHVFDDYNAPMCEVPDCSEVPLKGRILCNAHAYPAEQKKSERRRIIESQKKRKEQERKAGK